MAYHPRQARSSGAHAIRGARRRDNWFTVFAETRDSWEAAHARRGSVRLVSAVEFTELAEIESDNRRRGAVGMVA